jgi:allantoicase
MCTIQWTTLVQEEVVREDSHNFFQIVNDDTSYSHVRLTVAPGGGIVSVSPFRIPNNQINDVSLL